jgi:hypothetical protein
MALVGDEVAGHPVRDQRWVRRSLEKLQKALGQTGETLSPMTLRRLLLAEGIRPRANVKHLTPKPHPDRDRQFRYIVAQRRAFETKRQPVLSIDTKNKEKIGLFGRAGRVWTAKGEEVYSLDFPQKDTLKAVPYGLYDVRRNRGVVCVGLSGNTCDFAADALWTWWSTEGRRFYANASRLLLLADGGGSNGYRPRQWKKRLQAFADSTGLAVTVCHYPTGASKWNPIEHRLFNQITQTWAGLALTSLELLMAALRSTTTSTGLVVTAHLLDGHYPTGVVVTDEDFALIQIRRHRTCPLWNYTISPHQTGK